MRVGIVDPRPVLVCRSADKEQLLHFNSLSYELIVQRYVSLHELRRNLEVLDLPALEVIKGQRRPVRVVVGQALTGVRVTAEPRVVCSTAIVLANPLTIHLTLIDRWSVRFALTGVRTAVEARVAGSATVVPAHPRCIHLTLIDRWIVRFALTGVRTTVEARVCGSATVVPANPLQVHLTLIDRWLVRLTLT